MHSSNFLRRLLSNSIPPDNISRVSSSSGIQRHAVFTVTHKGTHAQTCNNYIHRGIVIGFSNIVKPNYSYAQTNRSVASSILDGTVRNLALQHWVCRIFGPGAVFTTPAFTILHGDDTYRYTAYTLHGKPDYWVRFKISSRANAITILEDQYMKCQRLHFLSHGIRGRVASPLPYRLIFALTV